MPQDRIAALLDAINDIQGDIAVLSEALAEVQSAVNDFDCRLEKLEGSQAQEESPADGFVN